MEHFIADPLYSFSQFQCITQAYSDRDTDRSPPSIFWPWHRRFAAHGRNVQTRRTGDQRDCPQAPILNEGRPEKAGLYPVSRKPLQWGLDCV